MLLLCKDLNSCGGWIGLYPGCLYGEVVEKTKPGVLSTEQRDAILQFDTCKIANAIERLGIRLRNEGFSTTGLRCVTRGFATILGHAVTSKVKCADPPIKGYSYYDLADWWQGLLSHPGPRIAVIQDVDEKPGLGAVLSDVHAEVLRALGCQAVVTNGAVRNVPELARIGFPAFASYITMSHSYAHMVDYETPVEILGLRIAPEDLLYVDVHGVLSIPPDSVGEIIRIVREQSAKERIIIDLCRSEQFDFESLRAAMTNL
jgi:4-hydroxy-4-methyl-2-oxoglutarate aldolase